MNEAIREILKRLAHTEAMLETILAANAGLYANALGKTMNEAEKHFQKITEDRTNEIIIEINKNLR